MSRSMSNYGKNKILDFDNYKRDRNRSARKKNKNISKWGKSSLRHVDNCSDSFIMRSPGSSVSSEEGSDFNRYFWE